MKLKYFFLLLLSLYIVNCTFYIEAQATIRYVSKTGNSTPPYTSWATAADSIQKCINICVDGDTIYVANGIYKENLIINNITIYLSGSSMDSTIVDGVGLSDSTIFFNNSNSTIENFNIYGKGIGSYSYAVAYGNLPLNIKNCRISKTGYGIVSIGNAGVFAFNLILETITVHGFGLFNNSNNLISSCVIILNTEDSRGILIGGPNTNSVYTITNNIIMFTGTNNQSAIGLSIGPTRKAYLNNNLISKLGAVYFYDRVYDTAFVKNNVFTSGAGISSSGNRVYANNLIMIKNYFGIDQLGAGYVSSDYNLFWENVFDFFRGPSYGDSDIVAKDPMFVNDTIPTANGSYDFHLQKYSPAIDKGDPTILDVDGSRSDIGMYGGPFGQTYTYQDLAPLAPRNLSAVVDTNLILVKWNRNTEADTSYYKVYRDTVLNFHIDSTKLVSSSSDTFFVQPNPHINTRFVYKVTCVDNQDNESLPSNELVVSITSFSTNDYPMTISDYVLYQNYPNPFNPSTKIGYQLKVRSYVKLMVYDIKGELVAVLVNKEQNAGYYEAEFVGSGLPSVPNVEGLASGIYLYRIEVIGEGKIPVYTEMKKMLMIK